MTDFFDAERLTFAAGELGGKRTTIGKTVFGREIPCVFLGGEGPRILLVAGHHAREHLSSECLFRALRAFPPSRCRVAAVLCANPDGAELCIRGACSAPRAARPALYGMNGGADFTLWKANGRGVDLNVNFPARFGEGRGNVLRPGPQGCIGAYPFSEPENLALLSLLLNFRPDALVTLHTKGEVLYWNFGQRGSVLRRDRRIARALGERLGFAPAEAKSSTGGLKDFAVQYLGIPAFTIELGPDELPHPLPYSLAEGIAEKLAGLPDFLAGEL